MILGLILLSISATADMPAAAPTVEQLQSDLQTAYPCGEIDGRKVWKGGLAYYIQSHFYDGAPADVSDIAADAVLPTDNSKETMREFEEACLTFAPASLTPQAAIGSR